MSVSTGEALGYGLIPFGDLLLRINKLKGSTDNLWTIGIPIFQLPVLGLIPTMMAKFGAIKEGKMRDSPLDMFIIITLIIHVLVDFISPKLDEPYSTFIDLGLNLFGVMIPLMVRIYAPLCKLCQGDLSDGISVMMKILTASTVILALSEVFMIATRYIPYVNTFTEYVTKIPLFGPTLLFALFIIPLYTLTNMVNENNIKDYCQKSVNMAVYSAVIVIFIGILYIARRMDPEDVKKYISDKTSEASQALGYDSSASDE